MTEELICISCPMGCHLIVDKERKTVTGNTCKRGEIYGLSEVLNPVRVVTSVVKINNSDITMLPVKTDKPLKKDLNFKCIEAINKITVEAPVKIGDIIIENFLGTGVNIVATRNGRIAE